jgi:hypothetical protein
MQWLCSRFAAKLIWLKPALLSLPDATQQLTHDVQRRELEPKQLKNATRPKNRCSTNLIILQRNPYISEIRF